MEAPRFDEEFNSWQLPTREYMQEEKMAEHIKTADRIKEIVFFSNIATFSVFIVIGCSVLMAVIPSFLAVILSIVLSFTMLTVLKKTIKTCLRMIKK